MLVVYKTFLIEFILKQVQNIRQNIFINIFWCILVTYNSIKINQIFLLLNLNSKYLNYNFKKTLK